MYTIFLEVQYIIYLFACFAQVFFDFLRDIFDWKEGKAIFYTSFNVK